MYSPPLQYSTSQSPIASAFLNSNLFLLLNAEGSLRSVLFPFPAPQSRKCLQGDHRDHIFFLSGSRILFYLYAKYEIIYVYFVWFFTARGHVLYHLIYHVEKQKKTQNFMVKLISIIEMCLFRFSIYFYASFDK